MTPFPQWLAFAGGTTLGNSLMGLLILASTAAYIVWLMKRKL